MKLVPGVLLLFLTSAISQIAPPPNLKKYQAPKFHTSRRQYTHGTVTITITQVRNNNPTSGGGYCAAWFEVRRGATIVRRIAFQDIEPVGGDFGLFVLKPVAPQLFTVAKDGDYEDLTLLTNARGETIEVPGWPQVVDAGLAFFQESIADENRVSVVDLRTLNIVYSKPASGEVAHWYKLNSGVAYTIIEDSEPRGEVKAHLWRPETRQFSETPLKGHLPTPVERYRSWSFTSKKQECGTE